MWPPVYIVARTAGGAGVEGQGLLKLMRSNIDVPDPSGARPRLAGKAMATVVINHQPSPLWFVKLMM